MILKRIIFFFSILIFFEIFLQFYYRIQYGDYLFYRIDLPIYQKSDVGCWKVKPDLELNHKSDEFSYKIFTNKYSQRIANKETNKLEVSKDKLVLFLGGYLAFGKGNDYDKSYAHLISEYYSKKNFRSINASVPAQLPHRQLCWFLNEGYKNKPEIIIQTINNNLNLDIPNNLVGLENFCKKINQCKISNYTVKKDKLIDKEKSTFSINFLKDSAVVYYVWKTYIYFNVNYSQPIKDDLEKEIKIKFNGKFKKSFKNYIDAVNFVSPKTKVIFLYIPNSYLIHPNDITRYSNKDLNDYKREKIYKLSLLEYLENEFNLINAYKELKLNSHERLYNLVDTSLNLKGNKIIYDAFYSYCKINEC